MLYHLLSKCARHLRNLLVICLLVFCLPVITAVGLICTLFAISVVFLQCLDTVGQQEGHPTCKNWVVDWWDAGMVICLEQGADLHMAQLMPLPLTVSCFRKIEIGFTFLVPAHLGSPGKRAVKRVCVCLQLCGVLSLSVSRTPQWAEWSSKASSPSWTHYYVGAGTSAVSSKHAQ